MRQVEGAMSLSKFACTLVASSLCEILQRRKLFNTFDCAHRYHLKSSDISSAELQYLTFKIMRNKLMKYHIVYTYVYIYIIIYICYQLTKKCKSGAKHP